MKIDNIDFKKHFLSVHAQCKILNMKEVSNNSRITKNTILLYLRMLILLGVSLYTSRVILATLGVEDYGLYNVVGGIVSMFSFVNMAMGNASSRFITYALGKGDIDELKTVFNTTVLVHLGIAILIVIIAETIGLWLLDNKMVIPHDRIRAAHWVYQFSIVSSVASMMCVPFNATIIAHEKMVAFAYLSIIDAILKLLIVYLLQTLPFDNLIVYGFLYMLVTIFDVSLYEIYCIKHFSEVKFSIPHDKKLLKSITTFAGWSMIGNLACVGYNQGINILLNIFFGPAVNAARGIAYQVQGAVKSFITNFQTAANPQITKSYATHDYYRLHTLLFAVSRFSFYLLLCIALPVSVCADTILSIWLVDVPDHTRNFLILILLVSLIDTLERPINTAMNATGEIKKYQIISCSIQVLVVPISYLFLVFGSIPEVIFVVYFLIMGIAYISELIILHKKINLDIGVYIRKVLYRVFPVFIVSVILAIMIDHYINNETMLGAFLTTVTIVICVFISVWSIGIEKEEKKMLLKKLFKVK